VALDRHACCKFLPYFCDFLLAAPSSRACSAAFLLNPRL
jgi:hypothetical protein